MKKGDIVIATLPTSDGSFKERPALIINVFSPYNDYLLCGISSQSKQNIKDVAFLIDIHDDYFGATGLHKSSIIRLNYLVTLSQDMIAGKIGFIPGLIFEKIVSKLIKLIKK